MKPFLLPPSQCPDGCGTTNYVQSLGGNANYNSTDYKTRGPFGRSRGAAFRDIADGLSNTGLFGEIRLGPAGGSPTTGPIPAGDANDFNVATLVAYGSWDASPTGDTIAIPECENRGTKAFLYRGKQYYRAIVGATYYSHTLTPNSKYRDCIRDVGFDRGHLATRSFHPGGTNICLADGSVRFATDSIDMILWRSVGSISGGEPTGTW